MSIDYGEIICTAVDEIVTAKLQGLQYDITKLCTVVDDAFSYQGKYVVSDGTARYEAYSTDTSFKAGNNVLVVIPNGDYNMQKTITGRVAAADTTPFNYTSPLDTMIRITNNIFDDSKTLYGDNAGLLANGNRDNINQTGSIIGPLYSITETGDFAGFTRLGITADFRTWLNGLDVTEGIYGLKVLIYTEVPNAPGSTNKNTVYELTFSSADMVGNPYQFESFFYQEKVFDISNINNIKQIDVYFYQNDEFKNGSKDYIPWKDINVTADGTELSSNKPNNLFVDNVKIYLGYETGAFTEETLMLYTPDSLSYHYNHVDLQKDISLRWIHMIDEKNFELLDGNNLNNKYEIRWFKYHPGWEIIDQYAGKDWEEVGIIGSAKNEIIKLTKEMEYKLSNINKTNNSFKETHQIQKHYLPLIEEQQNKIDEAKNKNNLFEYSFTPDVNKQTERIKAIGLIKEINGEIQTITPYYSNLLVFENEEEVPDKITVDVSTALSIECLDNTEGNYYIYNQNGKINNEGIGRGYKRYLKAMYQGAEITNSLGTLEWIKWYIPTGDSTMLISTTNFETENNEVVEEDVNYKGKAYKVITRKATLNEVGKTELNVLQAYSIDNQWNFKKSNNTIRCQVKIGPNIYEAIEELRFGKAGSNGTNITFLIEFEDNQNALLATKGEKVDIRARLYDSNNSRVDFSIDEAKKIKWSWHKTTTKIEANEEVDTNYISLASNNNIAVLTSNISSIPNDNYYILKAEYGNLEAYLPIPLKTEDATFIEGAREVIYNHQGIPNYYNDAYIFYVWNDDEQQYKKSNDGTWILTHNGSPVDEKENGSTGLSESYIPRLKKVPETDYVALSASQFYACGENDKVCVSYTNGTYGWSQPILIMQSKYDFAMLNEWDGSLTIDEENGTILSTMLGAGRKNDKNQFSGVLIGDIKGGSKLNDSDTLTGVYGLHEGVISYALKEDGTATFGKAGCGQIKIDGNKGQIFSPNYFDEENKKDIGEGMLIDLNDGKIHIKDNGFTKILIQPDSSKDPYLLINGDSDATLINIEDKNYYLQSSDYYKNEGQTGTHFDLADGELIIKKPEVGAVYLSDKEGNLFKVQTKDNQPLIVMRDKEYYLQSAKYEGKTQHTIEYNNETYTLYNNTRTSLLNGEGEDKETINITPIVAIKDNEVYQINETTLTPSKSPIDFKKTTIVRTEAKDENDASVNVVNITYEKDEYKNYFISQLSPKLINTSKSGLKMDLEQGYISGYDLRLNGINTNNNSQQFILDSSAEKTPFSIGNKFKVDWDGTVYCENIKYLGTKPSDGTTVININDNFYVTASGGAGGSSANFGKGYFGGGYFGGSAARVNPSGSATDPIATVSEDGTVGVGNSTIQGLKNYATNEATTAAGVVLKLVGPVVDWYDSSQGKPTITAIAIQAEAQLALKRANEALEEAEAAMTKAKAAYSLADSLAPPGVG